MTEFYKDTWLQRLHRKGQASREVPPVLRAKEEQQLDGTTPPSMPGAEISAVQVQAMPVLSSPKP